MKELLMSLNRTPGVLGSAYVDGDFSVCDMGDSLGGSAALPLAERAAEACRAWQTARPDHPLEAALFVGSIGRILVRPIGSGMLVAFAENDASAGMLRVRMREVADQISSAGSRTPGLDHSIPTTLEPSLRL